MRPDLRTRISGGALENKIGELLDVFFTKRIEALSKLKLRTKLSAKCPYLMKAIGVADAGEIVEEILDAHISSSDETIFGNDFFEPLAKWVAEQAYSTVPGTTVQVSGSPGVDISIEHPDRNEAIAVKSGTRVFNAQSRKKQAEEFQTLFRVLAKTRKAFEPLVGYCYGRKTQRKNSPSPFSEMAGQAFWSHLTGEEDFYLRIVDLMRDKPRHYRDAYQAAYNKAKNKFVKEFAEDFLSADGSIDWVRLTQFNSGKEKPRREKRAALTEVDEKMAQDATEGGERQLSGGLVP